MMIRLAILPLILALNFSMCKRHENVANSQPASSSPTSATTTAGGSPGPGIAGAAPSPKITKPVVDQTAQTIIFCYHLLVDKVRYPGTEITPAAFEAQMKQLKMPASRSSVCKICWHGNGARKIFRRAAR